MKDQMTKQELIAAVNKIIGMGCDPEIAHIEEDRLLLVVIKKFCPMWVVQEIERLHNADFTRWYA